MNRFASHMSDLTEAERHKMLIPMPMAYPELNSAVSEVTSRLQAYGVLTVPTFDITKNLYAVAVISVDALEEIADHIRTAPRGELEMWDQIFCYRKNYPVLLPNNKIKGNRDYAAFYRRMISTQSTLLRIVATDNQYNREMHPANISERADKLLVAFGTDLSDHAAYRAALIAASVHCYTPEEVDAEDMEFLTDNIDAVEDRLLEELLLRESVERELVRELLSATTALTSGSL